MGSVFDYEETLMKKSSLLITLTCSIALLAPMAALASADADTVNADTSGTQAPVVNKNSSIKSSIKAKFAADSTDDFALSHIDVDVHHKGVVSLEGKVPSQQAADRAVSIARGIDGVTEVKNQLKVWSPHS
jgi:hyperosmotically inducible periplasmic protein